MSDAFERRRFSRTSVDMPGQIIIPEQTPISCTVLDYSDGGAFLELETRPWLPPLFELVIDRLGARHVCEIKHTNMYGVGVSFVLPGDASRPPSDQRPSRRPPRIRRYHA